jgi:mannose-6-phosphate isomerase-like protein (cupin superfamily)
VAGANALRITPRQAPIRESEIRVNVPRRVDKPWGHEIIWAHTDRYVGKILHVKAGHALSLQYHERKDETIHLLTGEMKFYAGPSAEALKEVTLKAGESFHVTTGTVHRMVAVTDVDILEASTPDLDDVVRLEDRYGRV